MFSGSVFEISLICKLIDKNTIKNQNIICSRFSSQLFTINENRYQFIKKLQNKLSCDLEKYLWKDLISAALLKATPKAIF